MDILFINATPNNELRYKINGTMILATKLIQAGFDVSILRFYEIDSYDKGDYYCFINDVVNTIISKNPKCVSFYTLWPHYHIFLRISKRLKEISPDIIIVFGGPQSSTTALETMNSMECVDYISTGEGENTVVPFFTSILRDNRKNIEKVPGLYYRKNGNICFCDDPIPLSDLNDIPCWDESLYKIEEKNIDKSNYYMPLDAGRGCPFSCTFCSTSVFWKRAYRLKSPEKLLEEIRFFKEKYGIRSFRFSHDAFTVNEALVTKLCDYIINENLDIKWTCATRADCISEELILKMKDSGLKRIEVGVETGSPTMQKVTNKKLNLEKVRKTIDFLLKNNIETQLFFMYGLPEETEEDLNLTLNFYCDYAEKGTKNNISFCTFNPSTHITKKYFEDLKFDPNIKILSRDVFGYDEELEMIKSNKAIFPFYYNLETPVRNNFQYVTYFALLYRKYNKSLKFIRALYNNDMIRFYSDFYNNNIEIFDLDIADLQKTIISKRVSILKNTIKDFDTDIIEHLSALLEFDDDFQKVINSEENIKIQKEYNFSYLDFMMKSPIEKFSNSKSTLLLEKCDKKVSVKIVSI